MKTIDHAKQLAEALKAMQKAVDEIAEEFILHRRAANWGIINDAYVATNRALAAYEAHKKRR